MPKRRTRSSKNKKPDPKSDPTLQPKVVIESMESSNSSSIEKAESVENSTTETATNKGNDDSDELSLSVSEAYTVSYDSDDNLILTPPLRWETDSETDNDDAKTSGAIQISSDSTMDSKTDYTSDDTIEVAIQKKDKKDKKAVEQKTKTKPKPKKKSLKDPKPVKSVHSMSLRSKNDVRLIQSASNADSAKLKRKAPKTKPRKAANKKSKK